MKLRLGDKIGYQGIDYQVEGILAYVFAERTSYLARLVGGGQVRFAEPATNDAQDRALVLAEIEGIDITTPPPATIYHHGESYLLRLSGTAKVTVADGAVQTCTLWRYRAAGDLFLQIEQWSDRVRMLAGASVHVDMLEVRPATLRNDTA